MFEQYKKVGVLRRQIKDLEERANTFYCTNKHLLNMPPLPIINIKADVPLLLELHCHVEILQVYISTIKSIAEKYVSKQIKEKDYSNIDAKYIFYAFDKRISNLEKLLGEK